MSTLVHFSFRPAEMFNRSITNIRLQVHRIYVSEGVSPKPQLYSALSESTGYRGPRNKREHDTPNSHVNPALNVSRCRDYVTLNCRHGIRLTEGMLVVVEHDPGEHAGKSRESDEGSWIG